VFLNGDIAEKVAKIKQQQGPDLNVWGSGNLLQTLIKHDLVDVFWLMIYPITLGDGKLFDFQFRSGSSQSVLSALLAYQNEDGAASAMPWNRIFVARRANRYLRNMPLRY
jgi:hypothetical protein